MIFSSFHPYFKATAIIFFDGTRTNLLYLLGLVYSLYRKDLKYFTPWPKLIDVIYSIL